MRRATSTALLLVLAAGVPAATAAAAAQEQAPREQEKEEREHGLDVEPPLEAPLARARRMARMHGSGGYLGVAIENVDADSAKQLGLEEVRGVRVTDVSEDAPASRAGIREGDVIVRFDGEEVRSARQLVRLVRETPPGREVEIRLLRDGEERTVSLEVGRRSGAWAGLDDEEMEEIHRRIEDAMERHDDVMKRLRERFDGEMFDGGELDLEVEGDRVFVVDDRGRLGVRLQSLTDQLAGYFGVEDGALVASVRKGSPAAGAGIRAGDVLVRIGDRDIRDPGDAATAVREAGAGPLTVAFVRDGEERTVTAELPAREERPEEEGGPS